MNKRKFVLRRISEIEFSAEIPLDRFADPGNQVFGCSRNGDAIPALLQTHDAFKRSFFLGLFFHIPYPVQELLAMVVGKSSAELNYPSDVAVPDLQACGA